MRRAKLRFRSLASRLTGFSIPIFGLQWTPPPDEQDIVRRLLTALEDRRVLYVPYDLENASHAAYSVMDMREELTRALQELAGSSPARDSIRAMRAACRRFLEEPRQEFRFLDFERRHHSDASPGFFVALGELRAIVGLQVATLAVRYGIDLEGELAAVLPPVDKE